MKRFGGSGALAVLVFLAAAGLASPPSASGKPAKPDPGASPACTLSVPAGAAWRAYAAYVRGPLELPPEVMARTIQSMARWQDGAPDSGAAPPHVNSVAAVEAEVRWVTRSESLSVLQRRVRALRRTPSGHGSSKSVAGSVTQMEAWTRTAGRWSPTETRVVEPMTWKPAGGNASRRLLTPPRGMFTIVVGCSLYIRVRYAGSAGTVADSSRLEAPGTPSASDSPTSSEPAATAEYRSGWSTTAGPTLPAESGLAILAAQRPSYPDFAREAEIQGAVDVAMNVDPAGSPTDVRILRGHPALDPAVLEVVHRWRFEPLAAGSTGGAARTFVARVLYFVRRM